VLAYEGGALIITLLILATIVTAYNAQIIVPKVLGYGIDDDEEITLITPYPEDQPEESDGIKKLVVAALVAYDDIGVVDDVRDEIDSLLGKLRDRWCQDYRNEWEYCERKIWDINSNDPSSSFRDFFEWLDSITTREDRIVLLLAGHGGIRDGTYYFAIKTEKAGNKVKHYVVSSHTLLYALGTLGSALDFVWFVSCESSGFIDNTGYSIENYARNVIVWGYIIDVPAKVAEADINTVKDNYSEGNPAIEEIYDLQMNHAILDQLDIYYGLLRLLSGRPAEESGEPVDGGLVGGNPPGGPSDTVTPY